ncbi:hypothetical protein B0H13DRAFT_294365 [Mycena leptocephala]|nr:hypothetical protein B0H13DRAFT_294365 [Mycena leptocephala]
MSSLLLTFWISLSFDVALQFLNTCDPRNHIVPRAPSLRHFQKLQNVASDEPRSDSATKQLQASASCVLRRSSLTCWSTSYHPNGLLLPPPSRDFFDVQANDTLVSPEILPG